MSNDALSLMLDYEWPGNILQSKYVTEIMAITAKGNVIIAYELSTEILGVGREKVLIGLNRLRTTRPHCPVSGNPKKQGIDRFKKTYVNKLMEKPPGKSHKALGGCPRMPFFLNSLSCSKNYPRNINYMPVVIFFAFLYLRKNYYPRTASYGH